jgi:hypothetical protein
VKASVFVTFISFGLYLLSRLAGLGLAHRGRRITVGT